MKNVEVKKVNATNIDGVVLYDELRMMIAEQLAKKTGIHQMTLYGNMIVEYEPAELKFGRLLVRIAIDHNEVKEG